VDFSFDKQGEDYRITAIEPVAAASGGTEAGSHAGHAASSGASGAPR
jgi:hypothetical protein